MAQPKQTDPQFKLRLTQDIKEEVEKAAAKNNRSMNAEIVARLEDYPAAIERERNLATAFTHVDVERRRLDETTKILQSLIVAKEETQEAMRQNIRMMQMLIVMFYDALDQAVAGDMTELNRLIETQKKSPTRDDPFFQEMRELFKEDKG